MLVPLYLLTLILLAKCKVLDAVPIPSAKARLPSQNHLGDQGLIHRDSQPTISSIFLQNDYECPTICSIRMIEVEVGKGAIVSEL